jgi:hypothetical protein
VHNQHIQPPIASEWRTERLKNATAGMIVLTTIMLICGLLFVSECGAFEITPKADPHIKSISDIGFSELLADIRDHQASFDRRVEAAGWITNGGMFSSPTYSYSGPKGQFSLNNAALSAAFHAQQTAPSWGQTFSNFLSWVSGLIPGKEANPPQNTATPSIRGSLQPREMLQTNNRSAVASGNQNGWGFCACMNQNEANKNGQATM